LYYFKTPKGHIKPYFNDVNFKQMYDMGVSLLSSIDKSVESLLIAHFIKIDWSYHRTKFRPDKLKKQIIIIESEFFSITHSINRINLLFLYILLFASVQVAITIVCTNKKKPIKHQLAKQAHHHNHKNTFLFLFFLHRLIEAMQSSTDCLFTHLVVSMLKT
jgi:hypothetical protein